MPPRRAHEIPAAFSATGQDVPPSDDVAKRDLAELIGGTVAVNVARLLAPVLQRLVDVQERYACIGCTVKAKVAAANAKAAAEPEPLVKIGQAFTEGKRGPVCWECFDPDLDRWYS